MAADFACSIRFAISAFTASRLKVALLHWRVFEEGLELLAHDFLNEDKSPELELEPIEVLLCPLFRPVVGPARASNGSRRRLVMSVPNESACADGATASRHAFQGCIDLENDEAPLART